MNHYKRTVAMFLSLLLLNVSAAQSVPKLPVLSSSLPSQTQSVPMTTITVDQLDQMLSGTVNTVMASALQQGMSQSELQQLRTQLSTTLQQSRAAVLAQSSSGENGQLQVPTQLVQMLSVNAPAAGNAALSGLGNTGADSGRMSAQFDMPALPPGLGDGGMDTVMQFFINGLANAVSAIPIVGGALSSILKDIGGGILTNILNNEAAKSVLGFFTDAQGYITQLNKIKEMADVNTLLGTGKQEVQNRLAQYLGQYDNVLIPGGQTKTAQIDTAIQAASDSNVDNIQGDIEKLSVDPYKEMSGFSKYTNPLVATTEIQGTVAKIQAGAMRQNAIQSTGQSMKAVAATDEIVQATGDNVTETTKKGAAAITGAQAASTTLGAMKTMIGLQAEANNLNALSASQITAALKQVVASQDANLQSTNTILNSIIEERTASAEVANEQMAEAQQSGLDAAQTAAGSITALRRLPSTTVIKADEHPLPAPYGERPFLK